MKKLFTLFISLTLSFSGFSTHLMGGQITANYINTDTLGSHYTVELDVYRDTLGINMDTTQDIDIYILDSNLNYTLLFTQTISFGTGSSLSSISSVYGVEIYHFQDIVTFPHDGDYIIRWSDCCRNGAIINMSNPLQESMTFATIIQVSSSNPNSSPTFLSDPVSYLPTNTVWQYNPLPFDPDGDSLVWSMSVPYSGGINAIPDTVAGYEYLDDTIYSNASLPFSIDPITGQISWNAKLAGNFVVSFLIQEYRNGNLIGVMNRDMQFIVIPDTNNLMPLISNINSVPTNSIGYPYVKINPGQSYQLHLLASDPDINDVVSIEAFGETFNQSSVSSTFNVSSTGNGNEVEGVFSWNPSINDLRKDPYIVVFRTSDGYYYYDETIQFEVTLSTDISTFDQTIFSEIYPNPANNRLYIPIKMQNSEQLIIEIYNILGFRVSHSIIDLNSGNHLIINDIDLNSGNYIVTFKNINGYLMNSQRLQIIK